MAGKHFEDYEVLDLTRNNNDYWVQNMFHDVSKLSLIKQTAVGGIAGLCSGMLFAKVGKVAAATLGTSLLLLQVAQHQGYIEVNWTKVEKSLNSARKAIERDASRAYPSTLQSLNKSNYSENLKLFFKKNIFLATGFSGGFLVGLAV